MHILSDMVALDGGSFWMGSDDHYAEEKPRRNMVVRPFRIDRRPVTNGDYAAFVAATGYVTVAERPLRAEDYPEADPSLLAPGSAVFMPPSQPVPLHDPMLWWSYLVGANWRHPTGPESGLEGLEDHPVVHVAFEDAEAFARWAGKRLPTEAEWEFAARGGLDTPYAWGGELAPGGTMMANYWQGRFPGQNLCLDGWERTSPVGSYAPNGFGLVDMIGNAWEWTADWYSDRPVAGPRCCSPERADALAREASRDPADPGRNFPRKVLKGGSHLCAENYCQRYRPAARYPQTIDTATSHIGFRCAADPDP